MQDPSSKPPSKDGSSLRMIKDNGFGLYMLDKELKARTYVEPAPLAKSAE